MQDLTNDPQTGGKAHLVNSSMNAGNTTSDNPGLSMTAPGSASVLPVPDVTDHLPLPEATPGAASPAGERPTTIPLNWPPRLGEHGSQSATDTGYRPAAFKGWTRTVGQQWDEEP